jgi:hypothetical protein
MRQKDDPLPGLYEAFFQGRELVLIEIGPAVIEEATEIRARFGLKAATAVLAEASEFWTSDQGFHR